MSRELKREKLDGLEEYLLQTLKQHMEFWSLTETL